MSLDPADGAEVAEMLEFIGGWLGADADLLAASFRRFVATGGYDLAELRHDLARFAFLLAGGDGEELFGAEGT